MKIVPRETICALSRNRPELLLGEPKNSRLFRPNSARKDESFPPKGSFTTRQITHQQPSAKAFLYVVLRVFKLIPKQVLSTALLGSPQRGQLPSIRASRYS
jgi:hypothetical protein